MVKGTQIPITDLNYISGDAPKIKLQNDHVGALETETEKSLQMGVVQKSFHDDGEVVSPVFLVKKPYGSFHLILNLEEKKWVCGVWNLQNGKFVVSNPKHTEKLLHGFMQIIRFQSRKKPSIRKKSWNFTCFPNGLSCLLPTLFHKVVETCVMYIFDHRAFSLLFHILLFTRSNKRGCNTNVEETMNINFPKLGFIVHKEKYVLEPWKRLKHLGFRLNSIYTSNWQSTADTICLFSFEKEKQIPFSGIDPGDRSVGGSLPDNAVGTLVWQAGRKIEKRSAEKNQRGFWRFNYLDTKNWEGIRLVDRPGRTWFPSFDISGSSVKMKTDASTSGRWGAVC